MIIILISPSSCIDEGRFGSDLSNVIVFTQIDKCTSLGTTTVLLLPVLPPHNTPSIPFYLIIILRTTKITQNNQQRAKWQNISFHTNPNWYHTPLRVYYLTSPSSIYSNTDISSLTRTPSSYITGTMNRPRKTGTPQPYEVPLYQL